METVSAQERIVYVPRPANANVKQAAQYLGVSTKTILNYMDRGKLKPVYLDRRRFFKWSELERIAKNGVKSR